MKKILATILILVVISTMFFGVTAMAATKYYDANGNEITTSGMYYDVNGNQIHGSNLYYNNGYPIFGRGCYYGGNSNQTYVGGCMVYYYDADGNLVAGSYYYDADGNVINPPTNTYRRGCCGSSRCR